MCGCRPPWSQLQVSCDRVGERKARPFHFFGNGQVQTTRKTLACFALNQSSGVCLEPSTPSRERCAETIPFLGGIYPQAPPRRRFVQEANKLTLLVQPTTPPCPRSRLPHTFLAAQRAFAARDSAGGGAAYRRRCRAGSCGRSELDAKVGWGGWPPCWGGGVRKCVKSPYPPWGQPVASTRLPGNLADGVGITGGHLIQGCHTGIFPEKWSGRRFAPGAEIPANRNFKHRWPHTSIGCVPAWNWRQQLQLQR